MLMSLANSFRTCFRREKKGWAISLLVEKQREPVVDQVREAGLLIDKALIKVGLKDLREGSESPCVRQYFGRGDGWRGLPIQIFILF